MSPLTRVSPPIAFAIWTLIKRRRSDRPGVAGDKLLPGRPPAARRQPVIASTPVVLSLWYGQIQVFLALAFGEAFVALRKGRG